MAHFIGYIQGARGEASRLGTKKSGIDVSARGWNLGGSVRLWFDERNGGSDTIVLSLDKGSNNTSGMGMLRLSQEEAYEILEYKKHVYVLTFEEVKAIKKMRGEK